MQDRTLMDYDTQRICVLDVPPVISLEGLLPVQDD